MTRRSCSRPTLDDQETDIATISIQLDGSQINSTDVDGLTVATPGCTIDGLSITGFGGAAIALEPEPDRGHRHRIAGQHDLGQLHRRDPVQLEELQPRRSRQ